MLEIYHIILAVVVVILPIYLVVGLFWLIITKRAKNYQLPIDREQLIRNAAYGLEKDIQDKAFMSTSPLMTQF